MERPDNLQQLDEAHGHTHMRILTGAKPHEREVDALVARATTLSPQSGEVSDVFEVSKELVVPLVHSGEVVHIPKGALVRRASGEELEHGRWAVDDPKSKFGVAILSLCMSMSTVTKHPSAEAES